jgi:prepilin signal peptidase PulO-like enzyme (type II secretory pathway)
MLLVTEWIITIPFICLLVVVTFNDLKRRVIPDVIILPGIALVVLFRLWVHPLPFWNYIIAGLIGSGLFYVIALLLNAIGRNDSIGGGDIKLLALVGLALGVKLTVLSILVLSLVGTLFGLLLVVTGRYRKMQIVPFAPFVASASAVSCLWGNQFYSWLLSNLLL